MDRQCGKRISGPFNPLFYNLAIHHKGFTVSDDCVSCGKCARRCPLNNIDLSAENQNGKATALDADEGKRFIRLRVQAREEQILIRMENGYGGLIYQEGGRFLSSKPGRNKAEGVGIASVRAMAASYGGMAGFTYTPDTFTASVLLYTNKP